MIENPSYHYHFEGGRKLLSGDDMSKFMIHGVMEKSHWYAYSVHSKGGRGRKTTTWRSNNKFMIQEGTENIDTILHLSI